MAAQVKALASPLQEPFHALRRFAALIGDSVSHAFGDPREEHAHLPPNVGVQPYRDSPRRRR
ncbi:MAG: hypothetical protein VKK63_05500 [Synechococcus sp.]|nr:hypothetical protein [Synechococcus sp.]